MDHSSANSDDEVFEAAVGRLLLELADEWQQLQRDQTISTHALGVLRDVFGALSLQLGVRATELRMGRATADSLPGILDDFRHEFADAVGALRR